MRFLILLILGILFLIISSLGNMSFLTSLSFFSAGVLLIALGYYDLKLSNKKNIKYIDKVIESNKKSFREEAVKIIEVILEDCQIISKDEYISVNRNNYKEAQMIDSVFNSESNVTTKNIKSQVLKYKFGKRIYYSSEIMMDKDNLKIKLFLQKKTNIYIKNDNISEYFFDLDFLKE